MKLIKTNNFEVAANTAGNERSGRIAILMPGRLDTKDYANFVSHADFLATKGFFVVAIDPPGTWDSPGDLNNYTTSTYIEVINELVDHFGNKPTLLLGHSRGGATAMLASANPAVCGLALMNASYGNPTPPDPNRVNNGMLADSRDLPPGNVRTEKKKSFDLPITYFEDAVKHNPRKALGKFAGPKLLVHANKDEFTGLEQVKEIYDSISEPKMFLEIDSTHDYRLFPKAIQSANRALDKFVDDFLPN